MYVILVEYAEAPTEVIGPFDHQVQAQVFAEVHELGGYSIIALSSPNGWGE